MSWWSDVWKSGTQDWVFGWLEPTQVPAGAQSGTVDAQSRYLHVFLKSARVVDVRKGFQTFYGMVHSYASLPHRSGGLAEFNVVTTPNALKNVDAAGMDRVIQLNQRLVGPVPYSGGDIELEVGLFSVAASNLAAPYLELLEKLSKSAGVSYISAALPFAGPILEGMKLLTGSAKDVALEIGFSTTLSEPRLGYVTAIRAPKNAVALDSLTIDATDFRLMQNGKPLADYPYIVLEVTARPDRPDWHQIPEVAAAYKRVQDEYRGGREAATADALAVFRRIVLTCNDLLDDDARVLVDKVDAQYQAIGPPPPATRATRAAPGKTLPDLGSINLYN
jgi:hypothetical protein